MSNRYRFEADVYKTLDRIPLEVRLKLDCTGAKISLSDWTAFSLEDRGALCHLPVGAMDGHGDFLSCLFVLMRKVRGESLKLVRPSSAFPWDNPSAPPDPVLERSRSLGYPVSPDEWIRWDEFQRYALYKLSVSKNEPERFRAALEEFRGATGEPT